MAFLFLTFAATAQASDAYPVVVESYTSQSCGPCVAADKILNGLADRNDIIALTMPVNYWDILGWKDTLASDATTRRQKSYAQKYNKGGVYTPQMYVDGRFEAVGNNRDAVNGVVIKSRNLRAGGSPPPQILVREDGRNGFRVEVAAAPPGAPRLAATVWVLPIRRSVSVKVRGGENQGRTLQYRNVVDDIVAAGHWNGKRAVFTLARGRMKIAPASDIVVLVQSNGLGPILAATYFDSSRHFASRQ